MTPSENAVTALLAHAGMPGGSTLEPIEGGANNRVYRVETPSGTALLKAYFRHPADPRDRLGTEFGFLAFVWDNGVRSVPRPLARDDGEALGLYEWIDGRHLTETDVGREAVQAAATLSGAVNRHREQPEATRLGPASEACFTLAAHLALVDRRLDRLAAVADPEVRAFAMDELAPFWSRARADLLAAAAARGMDPGRELPPAERCLSPGDFGFHNALARPSGEICFLDFEYAGWDDPAKMIANFFCMPELGAGMEHWEVFAAGALAAHTSAEAAEERARLVLPAHRARWACILLNEFLPTEAERRRFAFGAEEAERRKAEQLAKARRALDGAAATMPR
jgi:phosphotransferase family enzyme